MSTSDQSSELHVFTDGGSRGNPGPAAIGVTLRVNGEEVDFESLYLGVFTNNEAEYTAFSTSVDKVGEWLKKNSTSKVSWFLDSMLVVEQLNKRWKIKDDRMKVFATQIWQKLATLSVPFSITYVPREKNKRADELVNIALDAQAGDGE